MKRIELDAWPRREIFQFFSRMEDPFYSLCFDVDVTGLYKYSKSRGLSFYHCLVYLCTRAINSVQALRCAIHEGQPVLLEERIPSFTHLDKGEENFRIITLPMEHSLEAFCAAAAEKSRSQRSFIDMEQEGEGLIFFSCLPWVELTAFTNARDPDRDDSAPRVTWGRYREEGGRKRLGMALELNHRFADGVHVGSFAAELERLIRELGEE